MDSLNPAQIEAVEAGYGPVLVLAGAGTGKTRVIVERMVWLIEQRGVSPRNILSMTFTNRAAAEMKSRVADRLGVNRLAAWVGTFHSFGLYVLRREMDKLGRVRDFTLYDAADQLSLMKQIVKQLPSHYTKVSPREALNWISFRKQRLEEVRPGPTLPDDDEEAAYRELWQRYRSSLHRLNAVDFDDLIVLTARLLTTNESVRDKYRSRYRHILVDEYQDTNRAQYVIARELCGDSGSLFVVGDEDQSIYSWRGADIRNILDFREDFPEAAVYRLEQNYRSTPEILDAANAVVSNNVHRLGKKLWTQKKTGDPVRLKILDDGNEEAQFVADDILSRGLAPENVAVLYRTNGQSRLFEESFAAQNLPYTVVGGIRFYARKEIKDLISYLRMLVNHDDDMSLLRIINVPRRGIGPGTIEQLRSYADSRGMSLYGVLRQVEHDQCFSSRARSSLSDFVGLIDALTIETESGRVGPLVEQIVERTKYRDYVRATAKDNYRDRLEVVDEFLAACTEFDEEGGPGRLDVFLQELALLTDVDAYNPQAPAASLMTCHSAKGLEFDHVYLVGLEQGLLPHASSWGIKNEIEEERRLCYVAMTRARDSLTMSYARERVVYGEHRWRDPSQFIDEVPQDKLVVDEPAEPIVDKAGGTVAGSGWERLESGVRVLHPRFGEGTVMKTTGSGSGTKVRVRFERGPTRTFKANMAPLEILKG